LIKTITYNTSGKKVSTKRIRTFEWI